MDENPLRPGLDSNTPDFHQDWLEATRAHAQHKLRGKKSELMACHKGIAHDRNDLQRMDASMLKCRRLEEEASTIAAAFSLWSLVCS